MSRQRQCRTKAEYAARMAEYDEALQALRAEVRHLINERHKTQSAWLKLQRYKNDEGYRKQQRAYFRQYMRKWRGSRLAEVA